MTKIHTDGDLTLMLEKPSERLNALYSTLSAIVADEAGERQLLNPEVSPHHHRVNAKTAIYIAIEAEAKRLAGVESAAAKAERTLLASENKYKNHELIQDFANRGQ